MAQQHIGTAQAQAATTRARVRALGLGAGGLVVAAQVVDGHGPQRRFRDDQVGPALRVGHLNRRRAMCANALRLCGCGDQLPASTSRRTAGAVSSWAGECIGVSMFGAPANLQHIYRF